MWIFLFFNREMNVCAGAYIHFFAHRRLLGTFAKRKIYGTQTKLTKTKGMEDFYKANEG